MTLLSEAPAETAVTYGLYDADQHYYEAEDAITRHLPKAYRNAFRWVDVNGRRTVLVNDQLLSLIPNPTYDPVGVPGSMELYFRSENKDGLEMRDIMKMMPIPPAARVRDRRVEALDAQGVDFAWLLPSLGLGLEEMLSDDPEALYAVFRSYNTWLDEDWGYDRDGRLQTGPLMTLVDPDEAVKDLALAIERGARFVSMRPAPVVAPGLPRSPGDVQHDRFWAMAAEAGVVIGIHAADSGYSKYVKDWGEHGRWTGMKQSPMTEVMQIHIERPISDMMAAMVCHGVFDRHPTLRVACLELGASWAPDLIRRFKKSYGKTPQAYGADPVQAFHDHVWIAPFYEDDISEVAEVIGHDRVLLGSDWPHPEGLSEPRKWIGDFMGMSDAHRRMALRDNLKALTGR